MDIRAQAIHKNNTKMIQRESTIYIYHCWVAHFF